MITQSNKCIVVKSPKKVRVSTGSAMVLGLINGAIHIKPTTAYLLTFRSERCSANCGFCPQARTSKGRTDMLSRVAWPPFPTKKVLSKIENASKTGTIERVCIQALNYSSVFDDICNLVRAIRSRTKICISVSCHPLHEKQLKVLFEAGVERVSIALDAATKEIFNRVKGSLAEGPYKWKEQRKALKTAVKVFGRGSVSTHLIVGLGENDREIVKAIQWCVDLGVYPSLFAFTPIHGTALENQPPPPLDYYRRIQLAQYLITNGKTRLENMRFNEDGRLSNYGSLNEHIHQIIKTGKPFVTSGCPGCNRPFYNERPGGPTYNFPSQPSPKEINEIENQIKILVKLPCGDQTERLERERVE